MCRYSFLDEILCVALCLAYLGNKFGSPGGLDGRRVVCLREELGLSNQGQVKSDWWPIFFLLCT